MQVNSVETVRCIGIDDLQVDAVRALIAPPRDDVLRAIFTEAEVNAAGSSMTPDVLFSLYLGCKEAVGKALGCGLAGIEWTEVHTTLRDRQVDVTVSGSAARRANELGISRWLASWSHCQGRVTVVVAGLGT